MNDEIKKKLQEQMLEQLDVLQERGLEYYNSMVALATNSLSIKENPIKRICVTPEAFGMVSPLITLANQSVSQSAEQLTITQEDIDRFCEGARKDIDNNSLSFNTMMLLKISLPLMTMAIHANTSKDQLFEFLAGLKQENII